MQTTFACLLATDSQCRVSP